MATEEYSIGYQDGYQAGWNAAVEQTPPHQPELCTWSQVDDEHTPDTWAASCGAMWTFTDGGPKDNSMKFCPQCGHPLKQIDNAMTHKNDPYASEAETQALLAPDTRTEAERKLDKMMDELGAWEQGAEPYPLLRHIALELLKKQLEEQPAQQEPVTGCVCRWNSEGDRVVTCERHQGWLEVIAEWADRARDAEKKLKAIYTSPPAQRTWVGLNEDQRQQVRNICDADIPAHVFHAIEAKLKEKNT